MRRGDTAFMFGAVLEPRSSITVVLSRAVGAADNECPARVHHRDDPELNHLLLPRARPFRFLMSAQRTGVKLRAPEGASLRATDGDRQLQRSVGLRRGQSGWGASVPRTSRNHLGSENAEGREVRTWGPEGASHASICAGSRPGRTPSRKHRRKCGGAQVEDAARRYVRPGRRSS